MNITFEFFSFNLWGWFLYFSIPERTESDLLKINWLCGVILLHSNNVGTLGQVFIVSHSYHIYFGFPESDLNLNCGLRDHVITRFTSFNLHLRTRDIGWLLMTQRKLYLDMSDSLFFLAKKKQLYLDKSNKLYVYLDCVMLAIGFQL
jgi:hypothetical protein